MTSQLYADLSWLPSPPGDFRAACQRIELAADLDAARALASHALDLNKSRRLARAIRSISRTISETTLISSRISRIRLGLVGNSTQELLPEALVVSGLRHGVLIDVVTTPYGQFSQSVRFLGS